jgi:SET domain-containing protein
MEKICDLKNRISVLRALLREQEEKLKVLEAIEKEKEELWLRERAQFTSPHQTDVQNGDTQDRAEENDGRYGRQKNIDLS